MGHSPGFVPPQLATLVDRVPTGEGWTFEIKYDGYRLEAVRRDGTVRLLTRRGNDWTTRFPAIARRVAELPARSVILDGELVALDPSGKSTFNRLQQSLDAGEDQDLTFFVFDLIELDGRDLRDLPLVKRRAQLDTLLKKARATTKGRVRLGQRMSGAPAALLTAACNLGLEGIIGKRTDAKYTSGRHRDWVKVKCGHRQEFVVVGFTPPRNSRVGLGSLLLAVNDGKELRYAGRVGSGFPDELLRDLLGRLTRLERKTNPLPSRPALLPAGARWVQPKMVVEVAFTEWTTDGALRHPVFQGIREDKKAGEVIREEPKMRVATKSAKRRTSANRDATVAGVGITHPDRVVYPESAITKLEVAEYFERIAPLMLPHVADRPLALLRCPEGTAAACFFQKHWTGKLPPSIDTVPIRQSDGKKHPHVVVHDVEGLVTLVQWGVMEIHPWGSRADDPEHPDRIVFDLDPGPGVSWPQVIDATLGLKALLEGLGLESWVKTSGGKGLHVTVPIARRSTWDDASDFSRAIAEHMQAEFPDRFISKASKSARNGLIFVDWLRNTRGATAVAAWSTRARTDAGVSVPIPWSAVKALKGGDQFTLLSLRAKPPAKKDPWADMPASRQALTKAMLQKLK